jgi:hypothetical protein
VRGILKSIPSKENDVRLINRLSESRKTLGLSQAFRKSENLNAAFDAHGYVNGVFSVPEAVGCQNQGF